MYLTLQKTIYQFLFFWLAFFPQIALAIGVLTWNWGVGVRRCGVYAGIILWPNYLQLQNDHHEGTFEPMKEMFPGSNTEICESELTSARI